MRMLSRCIPVCKKSTTNLGLMTQLFYACGRYNRAISICSEDGSCMQCGEVTKCLTFDSSDGEYTTMIFCKKCINNFFEDHVSTSDFTRDLSGQ